MTRHPLQLMVLAATVVAAVSAGAVQQASPPIDIGRIDAAALEELTATRTPGAAIAVIRDGKVIVTKGYGVSSIETGVPVTPETLFRLGSTTKMLTAALVVGLAEEGKVQLDAPIGTYVPDLPPRLSWATLNQLLSHTSGLRDTATMFGLHDDAALGQTVRTLNDAFFFAGPGEVYSYANPGYWTAGLVAEVVAGKPYADAMRDRLFEPLGMKRSTLRPTLAMTYPLAQGHEQAGAAPPAVIRPAADNAGNWPAGSVFSNVQDLSRFVIAFMNGGVLDGRQVLPARVVARMSSPHAEIPGSEPTSYGFGLELSTDRGIRLLTHGGSRSGYGSSIAMAPDRRAAVIVLANRTGSGMPRTARAAMAVALGREPAPEPPVPPEIPMAQAEMRRYAGAYSQTEKPDIELLVQDDRLVFKQGSSSIPVVKLGDRRFGIVRPGAARPQEFFLVPGADGNIRFLFRGGRASKRL